MVVPDVEQFFLPIVGDAEFREAGDFCYLARLHEWFGEDEEAEAVLAKAEIVYPSYWTSYFSGLAFALEQETSIMLSARRSARRELAPWKTQTWELLGQVYSDLGRATQAETARKRAEEVQRVRSQLTAEIDAI